MRRRRRWIWSPHAASGSLSPCSLDPRMLDVRALKGDRGILLHGKEGGGTQVSITQFIPGIDAGRLHFGLYPGVGRILLVNMEMSTKRVEASSRRADRQDSDSKRHV